MKFKTQCFEDTIDLHPQATVQVKQLLIWDGQENLNVWATNGELISVIKHNYNCMLDYGIY